MFERGREREGNEGARTCFSTSRVIKLNYVGYIYPSKLSYITLIACSSESVIRIENSNTNISRSR